MISLPDPPKKHEHIARWGYFLLALIGTAAVIYCFASLLRGGWIGCNEPVEPRAALLAANKANDSIAVADYGLDDHDHVPGRDFSLWIPLKATTRNNSSLPDIQIIVDTGFVDVFGEVILPFAMQFRLITDSQYVINCPLWLTGSVSTICISSDDPHMAFFLEAKSALVDANGNITRYTISHKPGSPNQAGFYDFEGTCVAGRLPCLPPVNGTLCVNQVDIYLVTYAAFGDSTHPIVADSAHPLIVVNEATPNAGPNPFPECPGCRGDHYFYGVKIWRDAVGIHIQRYDAPLANNSLVAKLKNLR